MAAIRALQQWCRQQCEGYRDVNISNMTTSFRDGLAFCAILHRHRPDLINYDALRKENVYENNKLAFRVAEEELGIPALLDAEDMVALKVPDRLSILTYVSQYYNYFHGRSPIGGMAGMKRPLGDSTVEPAEKKVLTGPSSPRQTKSFAQGTPRKEDRGAEEPPSKASRVVGSSISSTCGVCGEVVHLVQRFLVDGRLFHRSCFRCQLCSSTLHSGSYRATGKPGAFICSRHGLDTAAPHTPKLASTVREAEPVSRDSSSRRGGFPGGAAPTLGTPSPIHGSLAPGPSKASTSVGNRSPAGWMSSKKDEAVPSMRPAVPSAQDSSRTDTRLGSSGLSSESPGRGHTAAGTSIGSRVQQAREDSNRTNTRLGSSGLSSESPGKGHTPAGTSIGSRVQQAQEGSSHTNTHLGFSGLRSESPGKGHTPAGTSIGSRVQQAQEGSSHTNTRLGFSGLRSESPGKGHTPAGTSIGSRVQQAQEDSSRTNTRLGFSGLRSESPGKGHDPAGTSIGSRVQQAQEGSSRTNTRLGSSGLRSESPGKGHDPAGTSTGSRVQQAREKFLQTPVAPASPGPITSPTREQALSVLRRALPGSGGNARLPLGPVALNSHPGSTEGPRASPGPKMPSQTVGSPKKTRPPAPLSESTPSPAGRGQRGVMTTEVDGAVSRVKGPAGSEEKGPADWRGCLKPVPKKPAERSLELNEPPKARDAPHKFPRSPEGATIVTPTPTKSDSCLGKASPGPQPSVVSPALAQRRKLQIPPSLNLSGIQLEPSGKRNGKEVEAENKPRGQAVTSPLRLQPDDLLSPEIQRQIRTIGDQLDALERRGVGLEQRLRAAEGEPSEDALMVEWFHLIHEKQLLLRLESELMYKVRDQRLELQQLDLQDELRRLMDKPEALKSPQDRQREQHLLDQYVNTVNDRSDIVDFLDEDRLREQEEDAMLQNMLETLDLHRSSGDHRRKSKSRLSFRFLSRKEKVKAPE